MVPTGRLDYFDCRMRLDAKDEWHFGSDGIAVVDGRVSRVARGLRILTVRSSHKKWMILDIAGRGTVAGTSIAGRISPDETWSDGPLVPLPAIIPKDDDTLVFTRIFICVEGLYIHRPESI